jgi:alcohol dehydrogenase class IV
MGLHHGLCHVLGGSANVPHGIANGIVLPHAIRFNAEGTALQLAPAADAMGIPSNGAGPTGTALTMARGIFDLVASMHLPQRLRDVGISESDLPRLAEIAFQNPTIRNNPMPIGEASLIEGLLREAW